MVLGSSLMWSLTLRVSGGSRVDLCANTERIISHVLCNFFVVCEFGVIVNPFRQWFNFCKHVWLTSKETFFHCINRNKVSSKHWIFFVIEVSIPLVIRGFPASFRCLRLICSSGGGLSIVFVIIFRNWSKASSKILKFKGKLFARRLPSSWSTFLEKASAQTFVLFLQSRDCVLLRLVWILLILHITA